MQRVVEDLLGHVTALDQRIDEYDAHIKQIAATDETSKKLMQLNGIGPVTATALAASVGNGHDFKNGRQAAAWLGLVPGMQGSGGKTRLGRITKAGDHYLRSLLVMGARSLLTLAATKGDGLKSLGAHSPSEGRLWQGGRCNRGQERQAGMGRTRQRG